MQIKHQVVAFDAADLASESAKLLQSAQGGDTPDDFQVYADPAGHPFCLCWVRSEQPS